MDRCIKLNDIQRKKAEITSKVLIMLICIAAIIPFVVAARYAVFHGDDFAICLKTQTMSGSTHFIRSLQMAQNSYMTWQGTYLANIMNPFFNPLLDYSYAWLRIFCMSGIVATFVCTLFFAYQLDKSLCLGGKTVYIFALLLLPVLSFREYPDVYLWYVGEMAYLVPIILLLLGASFLLFYKRSGRKIFVAISGTLLFLMAGGPLTIGGMAACYMLMYLVLDAIENKKLDKGLLIVFVLIFIGDLINTLAPGNYARNDKLGGLNVFVALDGAFRLTAQEYIYLFGQKALLAYVMISFILGWKKQKKITIITLVLANLGLLLVPVVVLFPYLLGYNTSLFDISQLENVERTMFVLDISIIVGSEFSAFLLGSKISELYADKIKKSAAMAAMLFATALIAVVLMININESIPIQITKNLRDGRIQIFSEQWHELYDSFMDRPGEDIVLVEIPQPCVGAMNVSFGAYPDNVVNMNWAKYFGNNSICTAYYISVQKNGEG